MLLALSIIILVTICHAEYPGKIKGPRNTNDTIAIIGAGPAGIHMALRLKQKGFRNVVVYEKTGRIGGETIQFDFRGTTYDDPRIIGPEDSLLRNLISQYLNSNDIIEEPTSTVWSRIRGGASAEEMNKIAYLIEYAKQTLGTTDETTARNAIYLAMQRYAALYNQHFPGVNPDIIPEPSWASKFNTYGTIKDFLVRNNLVVLEPIFYFTLTARGLGFYDEVPALYGFIAVPATLMSAFERSVRSGVMDSATKSYFVKNGFQQLWSTIVSRENTNVVLNTKVDRLNRDQLTPNTPVKLRLRSNKDNSVTWRTFDYVIWTGNMREALKAWSFKRPEFNAGPSHNEYQNFLRINKKLYRSTVLVDSELLKRGGTPNDLFLDNIRNKQYGVVKMDDVYALSQQQTNKTRYRQNNYTQNADGSPYRTVKLVAYTQSPVNNFRINYFNQIQNDFSPVNVTFRMARSIKVNPQFSSRDITNSMIWKILKMQGKYGMWYTGASVIQESLQSQLKYNELLIKNMEDPITQGGNVIV